MKHPLLACLMPLLALFAGTVIAQETTESNIVPPKASQSVPAISLPPKIAFLMPPKGSKFEKASELALNGLLASNYASSQPAEVLLIRPGSLDTVKTQLEKAATAGAMVAVGPIDRQGVEEISKLAYLPLPVVTLNQVELDRPIPLTAEEIAERDRLEENRRLAKADQSEPEIQNSRETVGATSTTTATDSDIAEKTRISARATVPGLVLAEDIPHPNVRYEAQKFPRGMLMLGLSMEEDAKYVAQLGIQSLPQHTESGKRPRVLLLDHDSPLDKRISEAFEHELTRLGFAPDRFTVDINEFKHITKFFKLVVTEDEDEEEFNEPLIDQEADPVGWRQQQLRLRKIEAAKRARAALAEPPYHAVFLAMDANTASLIRSRLPLRSRVWATPAVYPGNPLFSPDAKALTYDLTQVAFVASPLVIHFDPQVFEEKYRVPAPETTFEKTLFALGADALTLAQQIASGTKSQTVNGLLGTLSYDLDLSPLVSRHGETAMIMGGSIRPMSQQDVIDYQIIEPKKRALIKARDAVIPEAPQPSEEE